MYQTSITAMGCGNLDRMGRKKSRLDWAKKNVEIPLQWHEAAYERAARLNVDLRYLYLAGIDYILTQRDGVCRAAATEMRELAERNWQAFVATHAIPVLFSETERPADARPKEIDRRKRATAE